MRLDAQDLIDEFRSTPGEFLRYVRSLGVAPEPEPEAGGFTAAEWAALMARTPFRRGGGWPNNNKRSK
jgi:hypothetical protein